jgi:hypothetical protein
MFGFNRLYTQFRRRLPYAQPKKRAWWHELSHKKKFNPHQFNIEKEPNTMDSVYEKNTTLKGLALRIA